MQLAQNVPTTVLEKIQKKFFQIGVVFSVCCDKKSERKKRTWAYLRVIVKQVNWKTVFEKRRLEKTKKKIKNLKKKSNFFAEFF